MASQVPHWTRSCFFFSTNPGCFSCTRLWWYIMCLHCSFTALDSPTETHCCGSVAGPALATQCQSVPLPSFSKLCCRLENILFLTPHVHIKTYIICSTCLYFHFKLVLLLEIIFSYNTSELLLIQADLSVWTASPWKRCSVEHEWVLIFTYFTCLLIHSFLFLLLDSSFAWLIVHLHGLLI